MYRGKGNVNVWMRKVTKEFEAHAKEAAPVREGTLKAGIRTTVHHPAVRQVEGAVYSTAKHTKYVIFGTTGPIMSNRAWRQKDTTPGGFVTLWQTNKKTGVRDRQRQRVRGWMKLPAFEEFESMFRWSVKGQDANNFLATGYKRTRRAHRALPKLPPAKIRG